MLGEQINGKTNLKYGLAASTLSWDTSDTTGYYAEFRKNDSSGIGENFFNIGCIHTDGVGRDMDHSYADNPTDGSLVWYENGNMSISSAGDGTRINPGTGTIGAYGNTGDIMMPDGTKVPATGKSVEMNGCLLYTSPSPRDRG